MSVSRPTTPVTDARASSRRAAPTLKREEFQAKVGDHVCVASLGNFEGIVRYIGPIEGKVGTFAGIELDAAFAGKGKNNGSVAGLVCSAVHTSCRDLYAPFGVETNISSAPLIAVYTLP
jgi:CAP-Gly domain-containing linker protein 1